VTEEEARAWVAARYPDAVDRLTLLEMLVRRENEAQNLIAPSTLDRIWARHIVDSLQLANLAGDGRGRRWLDIGTGGGFPGLAVAVVWDGRVTLCEPRRRRADFLFSAAKDLGLDDVEVSATKAEKLTTVSDVISARAVASVPRLIEAAGHLSKAGTLWLLPRGVVEADAVKGVDTARYMFHVEQSVTSEGSAIVLLTDRGARK